MTLVLVSKKYIVIGILALLALAFIATRWLDTLLLRHHVQGNPLQPRKLQGTPKTLQTGNTKIRIRIRIRVFSISRRLLYMIFK